MKWHSAMIKLTLKTTGLLLIIAAFSTSTLAQSPWAVKKTVVEEDTPSTDTGAEQQQDTPSAAVETDNSYSTVEEIEQPAEDTRPEYSQTEVTEQRGDVPDTSVAPPQNNSPDYDQNARRDLSANLSSAVHLLNFPVRGMSTDKVKNELGTPTEILPAVGQPPITRWLYNDRTVYFEYSAVVHVVAN